MLRLKHGGHADRVQGRAEARGKLTKTCEGALALKRVLAQILCGVTATD